MDYKLEIKKEEHYVHASASGNRTRQNVSLMAQEILEACKEHKVDKALVDVRELHGQMSIFDSFLLISKEFPKIRQARVLTKAVILDEEARAERHRFFERVAHNRGYNVRIFHDADKAIEWLCAEVTNTAR